MAGVLAERFIRIVNNFAGITHRYLFCVAVAIAVERAFNICDRIAASALEDLPAEYPFEPPFASA